MATIRARVSDDDDFTYKMKLDSWFPLMKTNQCFAYTIDGSMRLS